MSALPALLLALLVPAGSLQEKPGKPPMTKEERLEEIRRRKEEARRQAQEKRAAKRGEAPEAAPAEPAIERVPVPPEADLKEAEKLIRELFKDGFSARTSEARAAFAAKLRDQGVATKGDPAGRYVLFREAGEMAVQVRDVRTALSCLDETARYYLVDGIEMKSELLSKFYTGARTSDAARELAFGYRALITEAMEADRFDEADEAISKAKLLARRARDTAMSEELARLDTWNATLKREHQDVVAAELKLSVDPADPDASLTVGRYYCLVKEDWGTGLLLLANGSDVPLKAVAEKELAEPTDPAGMAAVGDGWWDLAQKERDSFRKEGYARRAEEWYARAHPGLDGLAKLKVEKRLRELTASSGSSGPAVNLLTWISADGTDRTAGWEFQGRNLVSPISKTLKTLSSRLNAAGPFTIPCIPPEEYDLEIVVARKIGTGDIGFGLICDETPVTFQFGGERSNPKKAFYCSLQGSQDHSDFEGPSFSGSRPSTFVFSVRKNLLKVTHNGRVVLDWVNPPYGGKNKLKKSGGAETLFLMNRGTKFEFSRIQLTPVSGGPPKRP